MYFCNKEMASAVGKRLFSWMRHCFNQMYKNAVNAPSEGIAMMVQYLGGHDLTRKSLMPFAIRVTILRNLGQTLFNLRTRRRDIEKTEH
jgi:hypothetical protein